MANGGNADIDICPQLSTIRTYQWIPVVEFRKCYSTFGRDSGTSVPTFFEIERITIVYHARLNWLRGVDSVVWLCGTWGKAYGRNANINLSPESAACRSNERIPFIKLRWGDPIFGSNTLTAVAFDNHVKDITVIHDSRLYWLWCLDSIAWGCRGCDGCSQSWCYGDCGCCGSSSCWYWLIYDTQTV